MDVLSTEREGLNAHGVVLVNPYASERTPPTSQLVVLIVQRRERMELSAMV